MKLKRRLEILCHKDKETKRLLLRNLKDRDKRKKKRQQEWLKIVHRRINSR
jgi:hypothetical protein